jgi:hypothetical protein
VLASALIDGRRVIQAVGASVLGSLLVGWTGERRWVELAARRELVAVGIDSDHDFVGEWEDASKYGTGMFVVRRRTTDH